MWFLCPVYPHCPQHERVEAERMYERGGEFLFTLTRACKIFLFSHMTIVINGSWGMGQLAAQEEDKGWFRLESLCCGHNTTLFEKFLRRSQLLWDGTFTPDDKGTICCFKAHTVVTPLRLWVVYICVSISVSVPVHVEDQGQYHLSSSVTFQFIFWGRISQWTLWYWFYWLRANEPQASVISGATDEHHHTGFYLGTGDLNSGSHGYTAST